jgi:POT family proton-dependent oligopeptide transporter
MAKYLTAPIPTTGMPPGIPFIVGNEAAERFSFYGMKAILPVFMSQYLLTKHGDPDYMTATQVRETMAFFTSFAYFVPLFGAVLADAFWGKYKTVLFISLFYCLGHGVLAMMDLPDELLQKTFDPRTYLYIGLVLIALGAGGIKPCVSANVGDQFGQTNGHLIEKVYGWFYFSINVGSFFAYLSIPILLDRFGPGWAFGVPGILMAIATFVFWLGRRRFVHIPPAGMGYFKEAFTGEGRSALLRLIPIYAFVAVFWSLYDQSASAWVVQAGNLDLKFLNIEWLQSQVGAVNPLLILLFAPLFTYLVYPVLGKLFKLTSLRKMFIGFLLTAASFAVAAKIEADIKHSTETFQAGLSQQISPESIDLKASLAAIEASGRPGSAENLLAGIFSGDALEIVRRARGISKDAPVSEMPLAEVAAVSEALAAEAAKQDAEQAAAAGEMPTKLKEKAAFVAQHKEVLERLEAEFADRKRAQRKALIASIEALPANADGAALATAVGLTSLTSPDALAGSEGKRSKWIGAGLIALKDGQPAHPNELPNIVWQLIAYLLLTAGEVMVSITALEFAYTQAPLKLKSLIMCLYLLAVSAGNLLTALVNRFTMDEYGDSTLVGADYYWFFTKLMLVAAAVYVGVAAFYKPKVYLQQEQPAGA